MRLTWDKLLSKNSLGKYLLICFLFFTSTSIALGQNISSINFTSNDGLPSSEVYDIIQDDFGYIWFSTDKGISRYNGYEFENFDETDGLPQHVVFDFVKDKKGLIWCTTLSGELFTIQGEMPFFRSYKYNQTILKNSKNHIINSLYVSDKEDVIVSFKSSFGALIIDAKGKCITSPKMEEDVADELKCDFFNFSIVLDDKQESFYTISNGASSLNSFQSIGVKQIASKSKFVNSEYRKTEAFSFQDKKVEILLNLQNIIICKNGTSTVIANKNNMISAGKLDENHFWIGYNLGGVVVYDLNGKVVNHFLNSESISQLYRDKDENFWASSLNNGIYLFNSVNLRLLPLEGAYDSRISSLEISGNKLFAGTYEGNIFEIENSSNVKKFYQAKLKLPAFIHQDKISKKPYFISDKFYNENETFISGYNIKFFDVGKSQMAYGIVKLYVRDLQTKKIQEYELPARTLHVCYVDDLLYLGTTKGLFVFQQGKFREIKTFSNKRINSIKYAKNMIVLATNGHGVYLLNKQNKILANYSTKNGLSSNFVSNIMIENEATIWCCTSIGICRINRNASSKKSINQFNLSGDVISNEIWDLRIFKDTLWIGAQKGLAYIAKKDLEFDYLKKSNFNLRFLKLLVNEQSTNYLCGKRFAHDQNEIEFQYSGISFKRFPKLKYRYQLKGVDNTWKYTYLRSIKYSALAPNNYEFIVQVSDGYTPWELNEIKYAFQISSPFWKTWWFITLVSSSIAFLIYLFFKYRILSYNRYIVQEILRLILKRIRRKKAYVHFKHLGKDVKIESEKIHFIKSDGNYLEIHTEGKVYLFRSSFENFITTLPDAIEYLRVHRSYLVRIDNIQEKSKKQLIVLNQEIPVGRKYWEVLDTI